MAGKKKEEGRPCSQHSALVPLILLQVKAPVNPESLTLLEWKFGRGKYLLHEHRKQVVQLFLICSQILGPSEAHHRLGKKKKKEEEEEEVEEKKEMMRRTRKRRTGKGESERMEGKSGSP